GDGEGSEGVVHPRAAHRQAHADLAAGPGITIGHERGGLFIASQKMPNARLAGKGVVDRRQLASGVAENALDAMIEQPAHKQIGAENRGDVGHGNVGWAPPTLSWIVCANSFPRTGAWERV